MIPFLLVLVFPAAAILSPAHLGQNSSRLGENGHGVRNLTIAALQANGTAHFGNGSRLGEKGHGSHHQTHGGRNISRLGENGHGIRNMSFAKFNGSKWDQPQVSPAFIVPVAKINRTNSHRNSTHKGPHTKEQLVSTMDMRVDSALRPQIMPLVHGEPIPAGNRTHKSPHTKEQMVVALPVASGFRPQVVPLIDNLNTPSHLRPQIMPLPYDGQVSIMTKPALTVNPLMTILSNLTLECQESFANYTKEILTQKVSDFMNDIKEWAKKCGKEKEVAAMEKNSVDKRNEMKKNMTALLEALPKAVEGLDKIEDDENMTVAQKGKAVKQYLAGIEDKKVAKTVRFLETLFVEEQMASIFPKLKKNKASSPTKGDFNKLREFLTHKRLENLPKEQKKTKEPKE